jgi:integrase
LTFAAKRDPRITNQHVWQDTDVFESLPAATEARNVILTDADVGRLVAGLYARGADVGLFADAMAVTGARPSQLARLLVEDIKAADTPTPYLDMPRSAKGHKHKRASKAHERVQVPITRDLAAALRVAAAGRPASARLLIRADGRAWDADGDAASKYRRDVIEVVEALALTSDDGEVTLYALRHSNIARMLLRGVPVTSVAKLHDTSVREIERHYASKLANHSDAVARAALFRPAPVGANVIPLVS